MLVSGLAGEKVKLAMIGAGPGGGGAGGEGKNSIIAGDTPSLTVSR